MIPTQQVPNNIATLMVQALANSTSLDTADLAALKGELTNDPEKRGYAGKTPAVQARIVNTSYIVVNPVTAAPSVPVTFLGLAAWGKLASSMLGNLRGEQAAALTANPPTTPNPLLQTLIDTINEQNAQATNVGGVDITGSAYRNFRPMAIALGATTDAALALVENQTDPNWTAKLTMPRRSGVVLSGGGYAEATDVAAALASA